MKTTSLPCPSLPQLTITHTHTLLFSFSAGPSFCRFGFQLCHSLRMPLWLATVCIAKPSGPWKTATFISDASCFFVALSETCPFPDASSLSFNCAASSALAPWCKHCLTQKSESARITSIQNRADRVEKNTPWQNPKQRSLRCGANDPDAPLPSPCLCGLFAGLRFCRSGLQVRYGLQIHAILQTQFTCVLK